MILNKYLEYLNENLAKDIWRQQKPAIIINSIFIILLLSLAIWGIFISSKRDKKLEDALFKITGKKYIVRILKDKIPNGFCFGGFGDSIFLTSALMNLMTRREVISVCLHEIGHITNLDSIKNLGVSLTSLGIGGSIIYMALEEVDNPSGPVTVKTILCIVLVLVLGVIAIETPIILFGKIHEYRADRHAVKYGFGKDLASALEKLEKWIKAYKRKKFGPPTKFSNAMDKLNRLLDVHPETKNRVEKLLTNVEMYEKIAVHDVEGIKRMIRLAFESDTN